MIVSPGSDRRSNIASSTALSWSLSSDLNKSKNTSISCASGLEGTRGGSGSNNNHFRSSSADLFVITKSVCKNFVIITLEKFNKFFVYWLGIILGDDTVTRPFSTYPTVFLSLIFTPPHYFVFPFIIWSRSIDFPQIIWILVFIFPLIIWSPSIIFPHIMCTLVFFPPDIMWSPNKVFLYII